MSNNPFLKSKELSLSNNRLNFLDDDDSKSSFKESKKSKIKNVKYEASQNSFTQPTKTERTHRDKKGYQTNYRRNNDFRTKQRELSPLPKNVTPNIDTNNTELFPVLTPLKNNNLVNIVEPLTTFKSILKNIIKVETPKKNTIPLGWVQLSLNQNRQTVIEYGPKTTWMIKQEQQEQLKQLEQEDEPNYIMFYAIESIKKNWKQYESKYDEYHGEGAYTERFRLSPVYGPEYDTETDTEEEEEEEKESEDNV